MSDEDTNTTDGGDNSYLGFVVEGKDE